MRTAPRSPLATTVLPAVLAATLLTPIAQAINITLNSGTSNFNDTNPHWTSGSTLTNNAGTANFTADSGAEGAYNLSITTNGGAVNLASTQHLNALAINGGTTSLTAGTLKTLNLTFATPSGAFTGTLDLTARPAVIETTPANKSAEFSTLQSALTYGQTHSTGILSSTLAPNMTIALVDNAAFGQTTFRGVTVDTNSLLLVPALLGDANLDGTVDLNDLNTVLNNLGATNPNFTAGNFDGAATIDLNDLNAVLNNLGTAISTNVVLGLAPAFATPTPEPASLALLLPVLLLMKTPTPVARKRRGHRA